MVEVVIYSKAGKYSGFQVQGHSGYSEQGSDIVCSGISAITQSAVMGLQYYFDESVEVKVKEGFLKCNLVLDKLSEAELEKVEVIIQTMLLGLESIKEEYKGYLNIVKKRRY
ncbi:MAG: uncharacterized protein PWQ96_126 [Clostridia bacterium]|jgi:hypothetical protein|nr:putative ribosomal protein [Clostridiales bacterium]MDK2984484.1 uncharacterized protein [Clostridia bacterium]